MDTAAQEMNMLPPSFSCPSCKCHALYRTRRSGFGWLMSLVGFWPARCFTCNKRCYVYLRRSPFKRRPQANPEPAETLEKPIPKRLKLFLD
jgi:hypothetical protein